MKKINDIINSLKVLYVEDDKITRIITQKILIKKVDKLITASNGIEGFSLFKETHPDIIITDLRMPLLNGINLIKKIRSINTNCGIIITSEVDDINHIIKTIDIGIDKYLIKPINDFTLSDALQITTSKFLCRKYHNNLHDIFILPKEEKKIIFDSLKSSISTFIKQYIGKGPKDIKIDLSGNILKIKALNVLTSMEKSLIEQQDNILLVEYNRNLFYQSKRTYLENTISNIFNKKIKLKNIKIDIINDIDELILIIS